ncbi:hypothetical protein Patl1_36937 [Pistacia atlantica]|nr:hypothetical protein Patl1_36937 [Pistacia atlantica]
MEMGLTLLVQSGLPKRFWVYAFLTSVFIINLLPTKVLDYSSPYQRLFHLSPNFTYFRSFGCQCFPYLCPYTPDKLSYHSTPCIFIGYCSNHKGFRCFDPSSRQVYISRNVIFYEGIFPAREQSIFTDSARCMDFVGNSPTLLFSPPSQFFPFPHVSSPGPILASSLPVPDTHVLTSSQPAFRLFLFSSFFT